MSRFSTWGNDLYTGRRSLDLIRRRKLFYLVSLVLLALTDLRVTARRLRGEPLTEDEHLDRLEVHPHSHNTPPDVIGAGHDAPSAASSSRERP